MITSFVLQQHINVPTQTHVCWIDLVITHDDCKTVMVTMESPSVSELSDHQLPICNSIPLCLSTSQRSQSGIVSLLDQYASRQSVLDSHLCHLYMHIHKYIYTVLTSHFI